MSCGSLHFKTYNLRLLHGAFMHGICSWCWSIMYVEYVFMLCTRVSNDPPQIPIHKYTYMQIQSFMLVAIKMEIYYPRM